MKHGMKSVEDVLKMNFESIPENSFWNTDKNKELKMHRIHAYPAKFPAFITTKVLEYFWKKNKPRALADIFCGCGTVAFEAKRNGIDFWGCDINPVATMIAKVKSQTYNSEKLKLYLEIILNNFLKTKPEKYDSANERLKYWYSPKQFENLSRLKTAIDLSVSDTSNYHLFFICAFSNILKPTSRWLTKSIKPQKDPKKKRANVISVFRRQCKFMIDANQEINLNNGSKTTIVNENILNLGKDAPKVDMIITSPPYVTSYEYADLHQLSSLWLGYTRDYRELRSGSIGSRHHIFSFEKEVKRLNKTGSDIVFRLSNKDKSKAKAVAKYFLDMQSVAKECRSMLSKKGKALFVIGNTEFKGVRIENARHLSEALIQGGFKKVMVTKRKIIGKTLTPYRDGIGKFTNDKNSRKIYSEEFILIGSK